MKASLDNILDIPFTSEKIETNHIENDSIIIDEGIDIATIYYMHQGAFGVHEIDIGSQEIKYIFNWKYEEKIKIHINKILEMYPFLNLYKTFYKRSREYLVNLNTLCFVNLISSKYEDNCINKFISYINPYLLDLLNRFR